MNPSKFISKKVRFNGNIAIVSIAVSFLVMILAVAISTGFRKELRDGIASVSGDVRLTSPDMNFLAESSPIIADSVSLGGILGEESVEDADGVIYRAGIVRNGDNIHGVLFKGVRDGGDSLKVSVPSRLASILGLKVGDDLPAWFIGEKVKVRKFHIASVYNSMIGGDDNLVVIAGLADMQRLNGWDSSEVSAIEVILKDKYKSGSKMGEATADIGYRVYQITPEDEDVPVAVSAMDRFPQIFSWLELIDLNMLLILSLMTIVAGFNMISGLLILLFRNISTIGTLKALGMADKAISEVFLRASSNLILKGMAVGNLLAVGFCCIQKATHLIKLNPDNYFLPFVPINLNVFQILAADMVSYVVIMLLLLIPCLFISKVDPAKTVRIK